MDQYTSNSTDCMDKCIRTTLGRPFFLNWFHENKHHHHVRKVAYSSYFNLKILLQMRD